MLQLRRKCPGSNQSGNLTSHQFTCCGDISTNSSATIRTAFLSALTVHVVVAQIHTSTNLVGRHSRTNSWFHHSCLVLKCNSLFISLSQIYIYFLWKNVTGYKFAPKNLHFGAKWELTCTGTRNVHARPTASVVTTLLIGVNTIRINGAFICTRTNLARLNDRTHAGRLYT